MSTPMRKTKSYEMMRHKTQQRCSAEIRDVIIRFFITYGLQNLKKNDVVQNKKNTEQLFEKMKHCSLVTANSIISGI